jgi:hypothetical protein
MQTLKMTFFQRDKNVQKSPKNVTFVLKNAV